MTDTDRHDDGRDDKFDPEALFANHRRTGEPLNDSELSAVVSAGLASRSDFSMHGGNLWWHDATFPEPDDDDTLPLALTSTSEPDVAIEIRDGRPACSSCGGSVQCSGILNCSMVDVNADCSGDGDVDLTFDYTDAGAAEFEPTGFHCVECGVRLYCPSDLRSDDKEDGTGASHQTEG